MPRGKFFYFDPFLKTLPAVTKKETKHLDCFLRVQADSESSARSFLSKSIKWVNNRGLCVEQTPIPDIKFGIPDKYMFGDPHITKQDAIPTKIVLLDGDKHVELKISEKIYFYSFDGHCLQKI